MDRDAALGLLDRLHAAQNEFYAGGSGAALRTLLASDVTWIVPGRNRIAGTYRGLTDVLGYFERRRDFADRTFQIERRDVLVGDGNRVAALNDGVATIGRVEHRWSTVGLYDLAEKRIAACRLLPLDQQAFDAIWSEQPAQGNRFADRGMVTADVRWNASPKTILSVLALSGALSEVLSPDVIIDVTQESETRLLVTARSAEAREELHIGLLDYGSFTEVQLSLSLVPRRFRSAREARRRLQSFSAQMEAALATDLRALQPLEPDKHLSDDRRHRTHRSPGQG